MERHTQEQETPDHQRIISSGSNGHPQRASLCPNHFQDSTTARTVLATILEIIAVSGDNLNLAYSISDRRKCPMLKCFHVSETPMEQIYHVASCPEASKGEIQCWTCQKCHEFKKWQTMCNTLKSPVELLRRLSNRKRGNNTSMGEPFVTKRGKIAVNDDFTIPSRQESHGAESVWPPEMEDPTNFASTQSSALELEAEVTNIALQPREFHTSRPLPTPPSTRNHSWSENSQNMAAYGDAKVTDAPEQPPPYVVSPQTTVDDYPVHGNPTDSLRLGIPPVQYISESSFMESPEDIELPEAPWDDHAGFSEIEDPHIDLQFLSTVQNATTSTQYGSRSEKTASIFSSSFRDSRMPNPHMQKQNTWPTQLDFSDDIPQPDPFEHQHHQISDGFPHVTEQEFPAANASQNAIGAKLSVTRRASFDTGTQDSITVSTLVDEEIQTSGTTPEDNKPYQALPSRRRAGEQQQHAAQQQYEECARCGQRFGGIQKNRRQHLKRHVASAHGGVRFRCGHGGCRRSYNRVDNLHDHERKCHRLVLLHQFEGPEAMAELAAGDVEMREGGGGTAAEGPAGDTGHPQDPGAVDPHLGVFGYTVRAEEDHGWQHGTRRLMDDDWDVLTAGVSGGQQQHEDEEEAPVPDVGHDELAPRPLDLPCVSWRDGYWEADGLSGAPTRGHRHAVRRR